MEDTNIDTWDLIVIGAGAVGENVADYATKGGLRTVVVEAGLVGGECSYRACMPSSAPTPGGRAPRRPTRRRSERRGHG